MISFSFFCSFLILLQTARKCTPFFNWQNRSAFFAVRLDEAGLNIYNSDDSAVIKNLFFLPFISWLKKKKEIRVLLWADRDFLCQEPLFALLIGGCKKGGWRGPWENKRSFYASVAQPVVQLIRNQQVACSSHVTSSKPPRKQAFTGWFCIYMFYGRESKLWPTPWLIRRKGRKA